MEAHEVSPSSPYYFFFKFLALFSHLFFLSPPSNTFWYDSRLRCDVADLYFELYGRKKPVCLPIAELAALRTGTPGEQVHREVR